jgi:transketolase
LTTTDSENTQLDRDRGASDASEQNNPGQHAARRPGADSVGASTRLRILDALYAAGSGHFGGACSVVEILQAVLTNADIQPSTDVGDVLILSKGHGAIAYYALLDTLGWASLDLSRYGDAAEGVEVHPCRDSNPWVHFSTGSLGQGLSLGVGAALAAVGAGREVWVVLGDGECQEGQVWEAADLAARYQLGNLHAIVDCNGYQECGWPFLRPEHQDPLLGAVEKWRAFGWKVVTLDGHSGTELKRWMTARQADEDVGPRVAIARTVKGAGIPYFEEHPHLSHCTSLSESDYLFARKTLIDAQAS